MIKCPFCEGNGFNVQPHPVYYPATREMAMDGGDISLEGYPVYVGDELEQIPCQYCNCTGFIE